MDREDLMPGIVNYFGIAVLQDDVLTGNLLVVDIVDMLLAVLEAVIQAVIGIILEPRRILLVARTDDSRILTVGKQRRVIIRSELEVVAHVMVRMCKRILLMLDAPKDALGTCVSIMRCLTVGRTVIYLALVLHAVQIQNIRTV